MQILPSFQLGVLNGWLPLTIYFAGLILAVLTFSQEARARLFVDPKDQIQGLGKYIRLLGQVAMLVYIGLMIFTPFSPAGLIVLVGILVCAAGYLLVLAALYYFRRTPVDQPVVAGPYRVSRNPQWVGLFLVLLGAAIATGIWLYIGIVLVVAVIYHRQIRAEEQICLEQYGDSYQTYLDRVPRYFLFL
ncbi:MAG: isoprenylcysteine carboxylmethyltransferase family protein [Chloroflexi bacterium]|nr:isoprenylcysteine carboxylmethyltransferase family protein [Chloroflexota bacterium]MBU1750514.1 isoprenylcysteine carboxylmethyltransferase family protein [Chloroflexota bacterium]